MADWMGQMADAVDEAEAANVLPQEEVPTETATSPGPRSMRLQYVQGILKSFVFQVLNMDLIQNQNGLRLDGSLGTTTLQKNGKSISANIARHSTTMIWR